MESIESNKLDDLKKIILKDVLVTSNDKKIISPEGKENRWLFDFRNIFLKSASLDLIAEIFWKKFEKEYPFQVGGQEMAAIPLVTAILLKGSLKGKPVNGFIIRKSRKPHGLQKIIEGEVNAEKIILVDDLINSGSTILRQSMVIEGIHRKIDHVFTIVNFRGQENVEKLKEKGILLHSLFNLDDFSLKLDENKDEKEKDNFSIIWKFPSLSPNYFHRIPKSTPCIDQDKIYFGSDDEYFYALFQENGSVAWKYKVGYPVSGKIIFSSPAIHKKTVYFGAYDGNVYAINKDTGRVRWKYMDADFVGSSPAIAPDINMLFIGLEFGLFNKQGGIAALDLETGKKVWDYKMDRFVHCSPAYLPEKKLVAIGGNDAYVYMFNATNGKLKWKYKTGGEIKASLVFDTKKNLLLFGSFDKNFYALDIDTGKLKGKYETRDLIFSTPATFENKAYVASLDKSIYCINLETGNLEWRYATDGRIFSSPQIIENSVVFGSNDGKIYELEAKSGEIISIFQTTERITNKIIFNPSSKRYFVSTYANEIYCLEKK